MSFLIGTLSFVMLAISLFMILLVLIQRGRGGGLAGAFGGMSVKVHLARVPATCSPGLPSSLQWCGFCSLVASAC